MCLDETHTLVPLARFYLHPVDSYRQKVLVTSDDVM